jgi:hypothetical protein
VDHVVETYTGEQNEPSIAFVARRSTRSRTVPYGAVRSLTMSQVHRTLLLTAYQQALRRLKSI